MNPRTIAAKILLDVVEYRHALPKAFERLSVETSTSEPSLVKELCYGVLRWYERLSADLAYLLPKPLKSKDADLRLLLLIGLYQLSFLRIPAHAAVDQTVAAARQLGKSWATRLVNAVLRRFLRESIPQQQDKLALSARYAHPQWLIERIQQAWPERWQSILEANTMAPPPQYLRVNTQKISRSAYRHQLAMQGLAVETVTDAEQALYLPQPCPVTTLPGFSTGEFSVQDIAAQLAAPLLEVAPFMRVLDACAAPGGKTLHLAELAPDLNLVAVDQDAARLKIAQTNYHRLGCYTPIAWHVADVQNLSTWWDNQPFARILLDAPCSATGVIRRHPDIKLLRQAEDIPALAQNQLQLLTTLWNILESGGILLYATCSILPDENEAVAMQFLAQQADAREYPIEASWGVARPVGRQIFPGQNGMDGFYYARFYKG